jgi:hypothetical protein
LDRSKPRKAALRGSPQPALKPPRKSSTRVRRRKTEGRAGPPGHQLGQGAGDRDPREDRAGRVGARQRQGGHGREGGGGLPEDKRIGVQEDGSGVTPACRHRAAVHLPAERTLDMAPGTAKTTRGLSRRGSTARYGGGGLFTPVCCARTALAGLVRVGEPLKRPNLAVSGQIGDRKLH